MKARNTDHGLLFTGEMVRALLDGRKTVTRRTSAVWAKRQAGDLLWVRETFTVACPHYDAAGYPGDGRPRDPLTDDQPWAYYRATDDGVVPERWTPSLLMPRWASRITLRVTSLDREAGIHPEHTIACHACGGTGAQPRAAHMALCVWCGGAGVLTGSARLLPAVTDAEARLEGVADRAAYLRLWREINGDEYPETLWRIGFEVVS